MACIRTFTFVRHELLRQQWATYLMYLMETVWVYEWVYDICHIIQYLDNRQPICLGGRLKFRILCILTIKEYGSRLIKPNPVLENDHHETQETFRSDSMHITHTNVLIEPYPVWLMNILCWLFFVNLSRHTSHTMRNLTILPVKFISWWF